MQGIVLQADVKSDKGIICDEDGNRIPFKIQDTVGSAVCGVTVDFDITDGEASDIVVRKMPWSARFDWLFWFLFSTRGRISRDQFIVYVIGVSLLIPFMVTGLLLTYVIPTVLFSLSIFPLLVVWTKICVVTKRFHDTNHCAGWLWASIILPAVTVALVEQPYFGDFLTHEVIAAFVAIDSLLFLFCLYLCFAGGNINTNKYGKAPYVCVTKFLK